MTEPDGSELSARYPGLRLAPVTVVIPAFDEEGSVGAVVAAVPSSMAGLATSVLVVDDGSTDRTAERAEEAGAYVWRLPSNLGQGAALRAGYRLAVGAGAEIVATLDADGQWPAADLVPMVELVAAGRADLVSGTRRGGDLADETLRRAGVVVFARLISWLTGQQVTDPANGLRVMTAEVARRVRLDQPQFQAAELLLSALANGFRYAEVPVRHTARTAGRSKKGNDILYGARYAAALLSTYLRDRGWRNRGPA